MSSSRSLSTVETRSQVGEQQVDPLVLVGDVGREPRDARTAPPGTPRACCGSGRPGWSASSASWSVSIWSAVSARPENASTTSYGELVRSTGISLSASSWPEPAGSSARYIAPSSVLTRIEAPVSVPNSESVLTRKDDLHVVALELDRLDLADADAGDPDLVVGLEPAGLGERGGVDVAAADQRQVLGAEGAPGSAPRSTARLIAPMITGLRSRKGFIRDHTWRSRCCR